MCHLLECSNTIELCVYLSESERGGPLFQIWTEMKVSSSLNKWFDEDNDPTYLTLEEQTELKLQ